MIMSSNVFVSAIAATGLLISGCKKDKDEYGSRPETGTGSSYGAPQQGAYGTPQPGTSQEGTGYGIPGTQGGTGTSDSGGYFDTSRSGTGGTSLDTAGPQSKEDKSWDSFRDTSAMPGGGSGTGGSGTEQTPGFPGTGAGY